MPHRVREAEGKYQPEGEPDPREEKISRVLSISIWEEGRRVYGTDKKPTSKSVIPKFQWKTTALER